MLHSQVICFCFENYITVKIKSKLFLNNGNKPTHYHQCRRHVLRKCATQTNRIRRHKIRRLGQNASNLKSGAERCTMPPAATGG